MFESQDASGHLQSPCGSHQVAKEAFRRRHRHVSQQISDGLRFDSVALEGPAGVGVYMIDLAGCDAGLVDARRIELRMAAPSGAPEQGHPNVLA